MYFLYDKVNRGESINTIYSYSHMMEFFPRGFTAWILEKKDLS